MKNLISKSTKKVATFEELKKAISEVKPERLNELKTGEIFKNEKKVKFQLPPHFVHDILFSEIRLAIMDFVGYSLPHPTGFTKIQEEKLAKYFELQ